jgi:hypothetical protein
MTPWRIFPLVCREHGGHLVREVVNGEQGQLGAFIQLGDLDRALERDLALLLGIDHHQNVSVLDHVLLLGKNDGRLFSYYSLVQGGDGKVCRIKFQGDPIRQKEIKLNRREDEWHRP